MPRVTSSAIANIDYCNGVLSICFHESGQYDYSGVPSHVYHAFLAAPSKGRFFNTMIKPVYSRRA